MITKDKKYSEYFDHLETTFNTINDILDEEFFSCVPTDNKTKEVIVSELCQVVQGDLMALVTFDPAAKHNYDKVIKGYDQKYVQATYKGFEAVRDYRISHFIYYYSKTKYAIKDNGNEALIMLEAYLKLIARNMSENSKVRTAIEIHPASIIGERFAIDHGYGTVIGETCVIGNDCYILQGVILGASKIKGNKKGKRHPTIGNNVHIGAFARITGNIKVGDNSKICPNAVIYRSIPPHSKVKIDNQIQITTPGKNAKWQCPIVIYGVRPTNNGVTVYGKKLELCREVKIMVNRSKIDNIIISSQIESEQIFITIEHNEIVKYKKKNLIMCLVTKHCNLLLLQTQALIDYINSK